MSRWAARSARSRATCSASRCIATRPPASPTAPSPSTSSAAPLFGLIIGFAEHRIDLTPAVRAFFLVGVLGGFTTFSAFTFDTLELLRTAAFFRAAFNVLGQITIGLAALWLGYIVAKSF